MLGVLYASLAIACGLGVSRALRLPPGIAPTLGLATMTVLTVWCTALGAPAWMSSGLVLAVALGGVAAGLRGARGSTVSLLACRAPLVVLTCAAVVPALLLGAVFAGVEAPVSVHDGAFHVEAIDSLRRGVPFSTWYPMGFHTTAAAVLGLAPGVDTARGTAELAQGLAILAPVAVFSFALALGLDAMGAAIAAALLAITWTYPYDSQLWGGWPQAMGVLLLIGVWTAALGWTRQPGARWAALVGVFVGAIVLTHGTEIYSAGVGLTMIAVARRRELRVAQLLRCLPLAIGLSALIVAPYLPTLLGWAGAGGAIGAAELNTSAALANPEPPGPDDWLQFPLGGTGAAVLADLPVRLGLILLGLSLPRLRLAAALWVTFLGLSVLADVTDLAPVHALFVLTYPWLVDHRPRQVAVVVASVLGAGGICVALTNLEHWRVRLAARPATWRRLAIGCAVLLGFFAEGTAVSIYKRTAESIAEQGAYSADDGVAMRWLKQHAQPGDMLANDQATDAGIWAPYKADIPILLPRSADAADRDARVSILTNVLDLSASPTAEAEACALHVRYLYSGAQPYRYDPHLVPDRAALDGASDLEEVFSAGDAAVFRIRLPCS